MPLRVLHVAPYSPAAWAYGGIPRVVAGMTRGLAERGHQVTLCTTDAHDGLTRLPGAVNASRLAARPPQTTNGVEWRIFPNVSNRAAYHLQAFAPMGFGTYLDAHSSSFDIAHLHACHNLPGIMAARALAKCGVPFVLSPNGTAPIFERRFAAKRALQLLGGNRVISNASRILAVSAAEERQLLTLGIAPDRIRRVPNPLDLREFSLPPGEGRFRRTVGLGNGPMVLFLGKITPRKHVDTLVEAFARVKIPDSQLVLAGNDLGGLSRAMALAGRFGLHDHIHTVGLLRGTDRLDALADADVVVYPSSDEVFGLVACEALLAGTPVIVGNDSGCAEIIRVTGGGVAVPPGAPVSLAEAISEVLAAPEVWRSEAMIARRRVQALFGEQVIAGALERVYCELLGRVEEARSA